MSPERDLQFLNILSELVNEILSVVNLSLAYIAFKLVQSVNIRYIYSTFSVLKFERSRNCKLLHP